MMTAKLTKIWHNERRNISGQMGIELRADFDNDRHHAVPIDQPHGPRELSRALEQLAYQIATDPDLQSISS